MTLVRPLTSTIAAVALALSGLAATSTSARADDDLVKFLAGATALVIIGSALSDRDDRRVYRDRGRDKRYGHTRHGHPIVLPERCAIEIDARGRDRQVYYRKDCLSHAGIQTWRLPAHCEATLRAKHRRETIYPARCLSGEGFRVTRNARPWR